jgi:thiol-disulfide isomerase/thioredoxin
MSRNYFIKFVSILVLIFLTFAMISCTKKISSSSSSNNQPLKATFAQYIKGLHKPVLVDFGSTSCVPCKMMIPVLEELKNKYSTNLETIIININEDPKKTQEYKIKTIPTQIFFDAKGIEITRHFGFISTADILATFQSNQIEIKP